MVAELAPLGWLASPLIKQLFDKAHHYLGTVINERRKILEDIARPCLFLAIEKAEKSPNKEKLVNWLKRLKVAYYEAEDAIDLFEYEQLKQKVKNDRKTMNNERRTRIRLPSKIVPSPLKNAKVKFKKAVSIFSSEKIKLKGCINKLIEIAKEANEFRDLLEAHENASGSDPCRETMSEPPIRVFGREIDKENIVSLLMKKPSDSEPGPSTRPAVPIIAITGRSGVGKTALAQYVYKHMDGQNHFDILVWVHTPRKFKATDVIKNMIEIIKSKECASNHYPFTSLEALLTQLRRMLGSKKLLLVLDDFWCDTEDFFAQWENFIGGCLSSCSSGSSILLTTQSKNVAEKANLPGVMEVQAYYLKEIEEYQFLELFMHYAWRSNSHLQKEEFKKIGRKIAVKLKRDPGAAKLVGQQLSGKTLRYWEEVAEKNWLGDNMKAKIWSYQQLPLGLQRCFAICSLFSKGTMLPKWFLIKFWMAEGFIRPIDKQERLEDIGENYLDELVSRFFIEIVEVGMEKHYQLHDLLHDLAKRVQGDDFIIIDSTNSREVSSHISNMLSRSENIRHILLPSSMIQKLKEKLCLMNNIRTFWVEPDGGIVPNNVLQEILKHMEKLRVLCLFKCVDNLPDSIGNLKHLRYLNVDGSQLLKKLPDSICKLYHLQTLYLLTVKSLPKEIHKLISLRTIYSSRDTMAHISHVGRLTSLQELDLFVVRKECGYELQQLENLNQLGGKMYIAGLENVGSTEDAVKAHMQNKKYLDALTFEWNSDERDTDDVAGLCTQHLELLEALQPQHNISNLTLKGFGGDKFPSWLLSKNSLNHLASLALMRCDKIEKISSIVEAVPNCKCLILQRLNNLKEMSSLPPNLTYLEIDNLPQLSYFSEDDLLNNDKRSIKQIFTGFKGIFELTEDEGLQEVERYFCSIMEDQANIYSKREESKLVLPSSLTILKISSCNIATDALATCIQSLVSLSKLELSNIETITSLPPKEVLCSLKNLQSLRIRNCIVLGSLGGIGALTSLIELELNGCITLNISNDSLPSSLEGLGFKDCSNVGVLHVGDLSCLKSLEIGGWNGHLEGLNSLTALNTLSVANCPEIKLSSPSAKYASAPPMVRVDNLLVLKLLLSNETISSLESLAIFNLQGDSSDDEVFQSLTSVKLLGFLHCNITHLPKNLKNLASLQYMGLVDCPNLCEFELEELPKNFRELQIESCPNLTKKLKKGGPYLVGFHKEITIVTFPTEGEIEERIQREVEEKVNSEMERLNREMEVSCNVLVQKQMTMLMGQRENKDSPRAIQSSCHSVKPPHFLNSTEKTEQRCKLLMVRDGNKIAVAVGIIQLPVVEDEVIHSRPMPPDHIRVMVDAFHAGEEDTPLPVPNGELVTIRDAVSSFIAWPMSMISLDEESCKKLQVSRGENTMSHCKVFDGINFDKMGQIFKHLHDRFLDQDGNVFHIDPPLDLFHEIVPVISVYVDDYFDLIRPEAWLPVPIIQIWMMYVHKYFKEKFPNEHVGFMDPARTCFTNLNGDDRDRTFVDEYIRKALKQNRDKRLIFIPYHQINHWVLIMLMLRESELYVFDSDKKTEKRMKIIDVLEDAFRKEMCTTLKVYDDCKCPQQCGQWECGYYVMLLLHDIIHRFLNVFPNLKDFPLSYNISRINEIRVVWGKFFLNEVLVQKSKTI